MWYSFAADIVVVAHLGFIIFVLAGGLLVLKWPKMIFVHLPAAAWGVIVELTGWLCPLTPLENSLRRAAGEAGYSGGFIEHYLLPIIYPAGLTREIQILAGIGVIAINLVIYLAILKRRRRRKS